MGDSIVEVWKCYIGPIFLSDSLFGTLIAENFRYLTNIGLHDAIPIFSLIFTFET